MPMSLSQVEAFRAVVLTGSTTAAARVLFTSQPNVSRSIAQLEKAVGMRLFDRLPGKLVLSEDGQAFFEEVQRSFIGLEQLRDSVDRIQRFGRGPLRVASVVTLAQGMLPRAIHRFEQTRPGAAFSIHMAHSTVVAQWVESHFCDLGIVTRLPQQAGATKSTPLYRTEGVCVMPCGHRLAGNARVSAQDLEGENFISLAPGDGLRQRIDRVFDEEGVARHIRMETPHSSVICSLVALGMGLSIINPLALQDYRGLPIVARPFLPSVMCEGHLITAAGRPGNAWVEAFIDAVRATAHADLDSLAVGHSMPG